MQYIADSGCTFIRGRNFVQKLKVLVNGLLLMLKVPSQHRAQCGVSDVVRGVGLAGQIPPLDFVLPLGPCFHPLQTPGNGLLLRLQSIPVSEEAVYVSQALGFIQGVTDHSTKK